MYYVQVTLILCHVPTCKGVTSRELERKPQTKANARLWFWGSAAQEGRTAMGAGALHPHLPTGFSNEGKAKQLIWFLCGGEALCTCGVLVSKVLLSSSSCRCWLLLSACSSCCWSCRNCSLGTIGQACCCSSCRSQWEDGLSVAVDFRGCIWRTRTKLGQCRAFCQERCQAGSTESRVPSWPPSPWSLRNRTNSGGSAWVEPFCCLLEIIH